MALYIDHKYYTSLYGEIAETDFNRLAFDACRVLDNHTTGADGFKKLRYVFPTDADDAESVKRCACKLLNILHGIENAEKAAAQSKGYTETENGLQGRVIASVSSGSESVSYATGAAAVTAIDKAVADPAQQKRLLADTVREYLSGVADSNGVKLLYMGVYPRV